MKSICLLNIMSIAANGSLPSCAATRRPIFLGLGRRQGLLNRVQMHLLLVPTGRTLPGLRIIEACMLVKCPVRRSQPRVGIYMDSRLWIYR
mmetsp:Transcript_8660/g.23266  ORF Transcript_8660/g.23266 Transcript_8660/m.23266 type:complete len:91 (+) Transcript_8660:494-766(+)